MNTETSERRSQDTTRRGDRIDDDRDEHRLPTNRSRTTIGCSQSWSPTCASTDPSCEPSGRAASTSTHLLQAMTPQEIGSETTSVYDNYVEVLETGSVDALQRYARDLSERIIPRGVETHEVVGIVLLLRDVLARSLFSKYHDDFTLLNRVLDAYEPAANRIANTVAVSFVEERERIIRQQQDAIRELSTPVLQVRERLLILPIIGVLDSQRAAQLTDQLLRGIRTNRAKVVVIDITGVPEIDTSVANHLVETVDASRLMGASVIITGLSSDIARTLVTIGVDLSKMNTIGDLQGGIEEAERQLGFRVTRPDAG